MNTNLSYNTSLSIFEKFRSQYDFQKQAYIPLQHIILLSPFCFEKVISPKSISTLHCMHRLLPKTQCFFHFFRLLSFLSLESNDLMSVNTVKLGRIIEQEIKKSAGSFLRHNYNMELDFTTERLVRFPTWFQNHPA